MRRPPQEADKHSNEDRYAVVTGVLRPICGMAHANTNCATSSATISQCSVFAVAVYPVDLDMVSLRLAMELTVPICVSAVMSSPEAPSSSGHEYAAGDAGCTRALHFVVVSLLERIQVRAFNRSLS